MAFYILLEEDMSDLGIPKRVRLIGPFPTLGGPIAHWIGANKPHYWQVVDLDIAPDSGTHIIPIEAP